MKPYIIIILCLLCLIGGFYLSNQIDKKIIASKTAQIQTLENESIRMADVIEKQSATIQDLRKVKTYQISLSPNVNTKVATTFGSAKEITIQYYFTMDGNKMELTPDSTIYLKK